MERPNSTTATTAWVLSTEFLYNFYSSIYIWPWIQWQLREGELGSCHHLLHQQSPSALLHFYPKHMISWKRRKRGGGGKQGKMEQIGARLKGLFLGLLMGLPLLFGLLLSFLNSCCLDISSTITSRASFASSIPMWVFPYLASKYSYVLINSLSVCKYG